MIVKVQRPIAGSPRTADEADIMVYDERRRHQVVVHTDELPVWLAAALVTSPKVFAFANWTRAGWRFNSPAKWQAW